VGGARDGCALRGRWRRRGVEVPGPWGRWGRWRLRGVAAPWGERSKGSVGSTRMEAPWGHWGGGAEGWLQPGMGSWVVGGAVGWRSRAVGRVRDSGIGGVDGGAMGWRRRGVGPGGWSKGWVGSSCPAEQGPAPPPAAARPLCPPQVLPKGYVMPVLLQLGPSRLLPGPAGPLFIHAPAGPGPRPSGRVPSVPQHAGTNTQALTDEEVPPHHSHSCSSKQIIKLRICLEMCLQFLPTVLQCKCQGLRQAQTGPPTLSRAPTRSQSLKL